MAAATLLVAVAGTLGFVGLWTYSGFKTTPGRPAAGLLLLASGVATLFAAGAVFAWGVTGRTLRETMWYGAIPAAAGVAFTTWLLSTG